MDGEKRAREPKRRVRREIGEGRRGLGSRSVKKVRKSVSCTLKGAGERVRQRRFIIQPKRALAIEQA